MVYVLRSYINDFESVDFSSFSKVGVGGDGAGAGAFDGHRLDDGSAPSPRQLCRVVAHAPQVLDNGLVRKDKQSVSDDVELRQF